MNRRVLFLVASGASLLILPAAAAQAQPPVIQEGQCIYLTGAPPGGVAAPTEERASGTEASPNCWMSGGQETNRDGENMAQAWIDAEYSNAWCRRAAWVAHDFVVDTPAQFAFGSVTLEGRYDAYLRQYTAWWGGGYWGGEDWGPLTIQFDLAEIDPLSGDEIAVTASGSMVEGLMPWSWPLDGPFIGSFGQRLDAQFRPGTRYRARMRLAVAMWGSSTDSVDAGKPGSGHFVQYDRIKVCIGETAASAIEGIEALEAKADAAEAKLDAGGTALTALETKADMAEGKLDSLESAQGVLEAKTDALEGTIEEIREDLRFETGLQIEHLLHNKECVTALWLPRADGGRLEDVRALVARRIQEAEVSAEARANLKVAQDRLAEADAAIAEGRYQMACRRLSDAFRALTTP